MIKRLITILIGAMLITMLSACSTNEPEANSSVEPPMEVVATVNGVEIKWEQFKSMADDMKLYYQQFGIDFESEENQELLTMLEEEAINILIQEELLYQHAVDKNYEVSEDEINNELEVFKSQFDNEDEFLEILSSNGLTIDSFRLKLAREKIIADFIKYEMDDYVITEEELEELYNEYSQMMEDISSLDEIRFELEEEIKQQKFMEKFEVLINELETKGNIEIFL